MKRIAPGIFLLGLALNSATAADLTNSIAATPSLQGPSITASLIRLVGGLLFIFALLFGALWFARNSRRFIRSTGSAPKLILLEVKSLGQRQALYVVGYEQQRLLLASSPTGITLLTPLPSADPSAATPTPATPSFAELLVQTVSRKP